MALDCSFGGKNPSELPTFYNELTDLPGTAREIKGSLIVVTEGNYVIKLSCLQLINSIDDVPVTMYVKKLKHSY